MGDSWLYVDDDSVSSNSSFYSDKVDSEAEAELYSIIHHQETIPAEPNSKLNSNERIIAVSTNQCKEIAKSYDDIDWNVKFDHSDSTNNRMNQPNIAAVSEEVGYENSQKVSGLRKYKSNCKSFLRYSSSIISKRESLNSNSSINKNVNEEACEYSHRNEISFKKVNSNDNCSDSDSSVIWTEPNTPKANFKTNLLDTISLSSDSADSVIIPSPSKTKISIRNNLSAYNSPQKRAYEDLWSINDEDLYRRRDSKRYHSLVDHCSLCDRKGHLARSCPISKGIRCFICGGSHTAYECRNKVCIKCYETGHDFRNCRRTLISYCAHCGMKGHDKKNCPDIWRRYHLTTKLENIVHGKQLKQNRRIYCFNCGWPDHFGSVCREPRNIRGSFYPTWPSVISYANPDCLLKDRNGYTPNTVKKSKLFKPSPQNVSQNSSSLIEITPEENASPLKEATPSQNKTFKMSEFIAEKKKQLKNSKKKKKTKTLQNKDNNKELLISSEENRIVRQRNFPRTPKQNRNINNDFSHFIINSEVSPFSLSNNISCPNSIIIEDDPLPESVQLHLLWQKKLQRRRIRRKIRRKAQRAKRLEAKQNGNKL